ncbi:MAG: hypothetical protein LBG69_04290 [Zoogloeaceae bacterium]|jgi:poly(3-hydroxybutyrate) depolymerase|nr:hypothetical protein [Zoogloeaceae bacterium]
MFFSHSHASFSSTRAAEASGWGARRVLLLCGGAVLLLALALNFGRARAADFLPRLNIDLRETTVSGISSGAFMAVQLGVAHSASVKGVAATAGGPYFCAGEESWSGAAVEKVIARCMQGDPLFPSAPISEADQALMRNSSARWAAEGVIDPLEGLARQKIWIFHGYNDGVVKRQVTDALRDYYRAFVPEERLFYKTDLPAGHAQISAACPNPGAKPAAKKGAEGEKEPLSCQPCAVTGGAFINRCAFAGKTPRESVVYDTAGSSLQFFYGALKRADIKQMKGRVETFQQGYYTLRDGDEIDPHSISMAEEGYLYIPEACDKGETCRLHIAFHGCQQNADKIDMAFVRGAGYNEWAELNRIVVLYPQASASVMAPLNPNACWDWWGYNDTGDQRAGHYATQQGMQISAVWRMAQALAALKTAGDDDVEDFVPEGGAGADTAEADAADDAENAAATQTPVTPPQLAKAAKKIRVQPPAAKGVDSSSSQIALAWPKVEGAVSYRVYRWQLETPKDLEAEQTKEKDRAAKKAPKFELAPLTPEEGITELSFLDKGLAAGETYQYKIAAVDEEGKEFLPAKPLILKTAVEPPVCDPYFSLLQGRAVGADNEPTEALCP